MKAAAINFVILCLMARVNSDNATDCPMEGFYTELACTALPSKDDCCCPKAFSCPELHPDPTKCYYKGVAYSDHQTIPQNQVDNACSINCYCSISATSTNFRCAAIDCVESYEPDLKNQCIFTYESDSCCSTGKVCGKDAIANLKTCELDGEVYREGEQFYPNNSGKQCICTAEWDGTINASYCKNINCGTEIHHQNHLRNKCAPVFPDKTRDCPIDFICQSPSAKIVRGLNVRNVGAKCVFGNATLEVGDEVIPEEKCTKCFCELPPFVTCTQSSSC